MSDIIFNIILELIMVGFIVFVVYKSKTMPVKEQSPQEHKNEEPEEIRCPHCGSTKYTLMKRGFTFTTGFIGAGKVERRCDNCLKKF